MSIVIKKIDNEYWLHSVSHTPTFNFNTRNFDDFSTWFKSGRIINLHELNVDIEYDLDVDKDFEIVKRIPQVNHDGLVYDDLFYEMKKITIKKLWKELF